ncbi:MAG TPA: pyridoxamine 5'-phosphate oxidase [Nocardioides sp.]|jgi:pyridoxamine 5'-phosphate oxidase|nr:pyridoxamine 5'-phosphate oxidase [Nocardioides sp.]
MDDVTDRYADLRREYALGGLAERDLAPDPFAMFQRWYHDAVTAAVYEPNAMVVASASADGRPSARLVLLKGFGPEGWVFFTNLGSRKGAELIANPQVSLLFPWHALERQVRVDGTATVLGRDEVAAYFHTRPRGAQLGAHASHQSQEVASREELDAAWAVADSTYRDEVPVPDEWGGFRVRPEAVEFWQGRPGRMHDRLVYRRHGETWSVHRLAP